MTDHYSRAAKVKWKRPNKNSYGVQQILGFINFLKHLNITSMIIQLGVKWVDVCCLKVTIISGNLI